MDSEQYRKLKRKVTHAARNLGAASLADDITQDIALAYASGQAQHQTVTQSVIDRVRLILGDDRALTRDSRKAFNAAISWESVWKSIDTGHESTAVTALEARDCLGYLDQADRAIVVLYVKWGFTMKEIAEVLGISGPCVHDRLRRFAL